MFCRFEFYLPMYIWIVPRINNFKIIHSMRLDNWSFLKGAVYHKFDDVDLKFLALRKLVLAVNLVPPSLMPSTASSSLSILRGDFSLEYLLENLSINLISPSFSMVLSHIFYQWPQIVSLSDFSDYCYDSLRWGHLFVFLAILYFVIFCPQYQPLFSSSNKT